MKSAYVAAKKFLHSSGKRKYKWSKSNIPEVVSYRKAMERFDKELRHAKRKFRVEKIADIEQLAEKGDPKKFWDAVNKLGPRAKKSVFCEAIDDNGEVSRDPRLVNELWFTEYSQLYGSPSQGDFDDEHLHDVERRLRHLQQEGGRNELLDSPITEQEVQKVVKLLSAKKACGLDGIPNEVLKLPLCVGVLTRLFEACFKSGILPNIWKRCVIYPIGKGLSTISTEPLSHRGLALQSCVYKLYSLILNRRLTSFFEDENILHDTQNGFRKDRSCIDHIFTLTETIRMNLPNNDSNVYACFVDLRKAFPSVNRNLLLWKLWNSGVKGRIFDALAATYSDPQYCLQLNGNLTDLFPSVQGLPEGDPKFPYLFFTTY